MHKTGKVAQGLACWLQYERRCGREELFSERYLAHPLAQLLRNYYVRRILAEHPHPVLAGRNPGRPPSVDFLVPKTEKYEAIAIETKWVSRSTTLVRDILRDIVRLDLMIPDHAGEAFLILAGQKSACENLFSTRVFARERPGMTPFTILPTGLRQKATLRFNAPTKWRRDIYQSALEAFEGLRISSEISVSLSGPFPQEALKSDYVVYLWRISQGEGAPRFTVGG